METAKKAKPLTVAAQVLFTLCLVFSVWFIFQNSLEIAQVSGARSEQVRALLNKVAGVVGLGPFSLHTVRKLAHFTEFALMGFWFMLCLRVYTRHFIKHVSWPLFCGLLVAVLDETVQLYVPGRSSSVRDVLIDFGGALCGLFLALLILMFCRMCYILFLHRKEV